MNIVDFASQVLKMNDENEKLKLENERLQGIEEKYSELLTDMLSYQSMHSAQVLDLLLHDGKFTISEPWKTT